MLSSRPGLLHDAELFSFVHYPGIFPGVGTVIGEVFELTQEGLEICDGIESHPGFYQRRRTSVEVDGELTEVWVYWAPQNMSEAGRRIDSGDWFNRDRSLHDGRTLDQALAEDREKH